MDFSHDMVCVRIWVWIKYNYDDILIFTAETKHDPQLFGFYLTLGLDIMIWKCGGKQ